MQKIVKFKCDICGKEYDKEEDCKACEDKCGTSYSYFSLEFTPSTGKFTSASTELGGEPVRKDEIAREVTLDDEGNEVIIWSVCVDRKRKESEIIGEYLAKAARDYLAQAASDLDRCLDSSM